MGKKRGTRQIFKSGNYFPDLSLGLANNYIYYNSLLTGDDEAFEGNRRIGQQVQAYLSNDIKQGRFSANADNDMDIVLPALNLILQAANNERHKEFAWLTEMCEVLGLDAPSNELDFDYSDFIIIINEVKKGSQATLAAIAAEKERLSRIDFNAILEAKKKQRSLEAQARYLERHKLNTNKQKQTIDEIREEGAKQYYEAIKNMGDPQAKKNELTALNSKLEEIRSSAHKFFSSNRSNFTTQALKLLMPIATKAVMIQGGHVRFNAALLDRVLQDLLMSIVEKIVITELTTDLDPQRGQSSKTLNSSKKQLGLRLETEINKMLSTEDGKAKLEELAHIICRENAFISQLEQEYMTDEQSELIKTYKENAKKTDQISQNLLKRLRETKTIQEEYQRATGKKWKATSAASTKLFNKWIKETKGQELDFTIASIRELASNSFSGSWYYSEQRTLNEAINEAIRSTQPGLVGHAFRPNNFPKVDSAMGYLTFNLNYDDKPLQQKQLKLQRYIKEIEQAQAQMDKGLQDLYNGTNYSNLKLTKHISQNSSVDDYTENAEAFLELRNKQLAILDALTEKINQQQADLTALMTRFNVLTTVKDQEGILSPRQGQRIGAQGKNFVEAGIGFSGGAMGKNDLGFSALDNIVALGQKGGILTSEDITWLKFALVNSGLGLLGFKNRATLENYFSLFASFLMFDDAQNIVADAVSQRAQEIGKQNTVQEIHLYVFNGIYYPQSYILTELYNHMIEAIKNMTFNKRNLSKGVVRTQIYGYNVGSQYPGNTKEDWEREATTAAQTTKIKMYFLMNMADIVNQLYTKALRF